MVKVKVCGITNAQDAFKAVELGVDALGFIFASSPRRVNPEKARKIISSIPPFVLTVGVFVNEEQAVMKQIKNFCGLDLVQLHGNEPPDVCEGLMPRIIKGFRIRNRSDIESVTPYKGKIRAILLDTYERGQRGGTGETFDWNLAVKKKEAGVPIILAGGLTPANIVDAISTVTPYAVDVNSGIEERPGEKDHTLMKELMDNIRKAGF